ncbi:heavy metal-binding domain-containing protein [Streptomyces sp. CS62]
MAHQRFTQVLGNAGRNVEIEPFTQALYDARELAMSRMRAEGEALEAEGIVAVRLQQHPRLGRPHHRVLRRRDGRTPAARRPRHRPAGPGGEPRWVNPT